jgi:hypothetical protein
MKAWIIALMFAATATPALAQDAEPPTPDHEAGVPLTPAEAAGAWTVEAGGHSLCVVRLGAGKAGVDGYALQAPETCGDALPAGLTAWTPTPDGMRLTGPGGSPSVRFGRWSNSLFVAKRSSGTDVQLRRGAAG